MELKELKNTVVNLRTQEEYDEYMQMCEDVGWRWFDGKKPTDFDFWFHYKEETCVLVEDNFKYKDIDYYKRDGDTILTLDELKDKFNIKKTMSLKTKLKELKNTVVNLRTQEEYYEYMQMCEDVGWRWEDGGKPTDSNAWKYFKEKTCVRVEDNFVYGDDDYYEADGYTILTLDELKEKFNINNNNKTIMSTLKTKLKELTLREPKKSFVKAGLMDVDGEWSCEAKETARDMMLEEYMDGKDFQDKMLKVAKKIIKE